jgi:hypothetical protein
VHAHGGGVGCGCGPQRGQRGPPGLHLCPLRLSASPGYSPRAARPPPPLQDPSAAVRDELVVGSRWRAAFTATALSRCELFYLPAAEFHAVLRDHPEEAERLMEQAQRCVCVCWWWWWCVGGEGQRCERVSGLSGGGLRNCRAGGQGGPVARTRVLWSRLQRDVFTRGSSKAHCPAPDFTQLFGEGGKGQRRKGPAVAKQRRGRCRARCGGRPRQLKHLQQPASWASCAHGE